MSPTLKTKPVPSAKIAKASSRRSRPQLTRVRGQSASRQSALSFASPQKTLKLVGAVMGALEVALILLTRYISVATGQNFFTERTFFTLFSTMQIFAVGLISLAAAALTIAAKRGGAAVYAWALAGAFAFFLAIDEWFEVHEAVAKHSGTLYRWLGIPLKPSYWDAPLFLVYMAVAGALWSVLKSDLKATSLSKYAVRAAGLALALSISFDMGMHRVVPVAWEDGFKLVGFMFIGLAFAAVAVNKYHLQKSPA